MKPTPEQIITWAHDAGMTPISHVSTADVICNAMSIVIFAALAYEAGRKDENEACAKVCNELVLEHPGRADLTAQQCAFAIRARGEQ